MKFSLANKLLVWVLSIFIVVIAVVTVYNYKKTSQNTISFLGAFSKGR